MRTAVYAGTFDPPTNGHLYMIREGARRFDRLVVSICDNPDKQPTFPAAQWNALLHTMPRGLRNVRTGHFEHRYLIEYAAGIGARYILRGIRNAEDYAFESTMRNINGDMSPDITTVFLIPPRELSDIS